MRTTVKTLYDKSDSTIIIYGALCTISHRTMLDCLPYCLLWVWWCVKVDKKSSIFCYNFVLWPNIPLILFAFVIIFENINFDNIFSFLPKY